MFNINLPCTMENKENTRPFVIRENSSDSSDDDASRILYRDDDTSRQAKIARKESLSLKLQLRPDKQDLINRNILHPVNDNDVKESKEAIGARLIRRLSMRPTADELVERNILKSKLHTSVGSMHSIHIWYLCSTNTRRREKTKRREEIVFIA